MGFGLDQLVGFSWFVLDTTRVFGRFILGLLDTRQLTSDYKKLPTAAAVIALCCVVTGT